LECTTVFINAECGKGIDIFFALKRSDSNGYVMILDQRKKEAKKLGPTYLKNLSDLITSSIPTFLQNNWLSEMKFNLRKRFYPTSATPPLSQQVQFIPVIFSTWGIIGADRTEYPQNTCIYGWKQITKFLMPFTNHPAVTGMVDVNVINQSLLQVLLAIDADTAKAVIAQREKKCFRSFASLEDFLSLKRTEDKKKAKNLEDSNLKLLFFLDDYVKTGKGAGGNE
jgi:hypothetical protein